MASVTAAKLEHWWVVKCKSPELRGKENHNNILLSKYGDVLPFREPIGGIPPEAPCNDWEEECPYCNAVHKYRKSDVFTAVVDINQVGQPRLFEDCSRRTCPISQQELVRHAEQICNRLLSEQLPNPDNPDLDGAFNPDGRIAPTATCLEGLLAALEFLPKEDSQLRSRINAAVARGISFLLRVQIKSGPYAGGMPRAYSNGSPAPILIRIDFVQHALCAWIRYQESFEISKLSSGL